MKAMWAEEVREMDIPLNVQVHCDDGLCGHSTEVVLHPETDEVTHLVVKEAHAPHIERLVPVSLVRETTPHLILLRCNKQKLAQLQPFVAVEARREQIPHYVAELGGIPVSVLESRWVTRKHKAIPWGELGVRWHARIEATDGRVGQLDEFLVEPETEHITHLVMREGHLWGEKDVTIPVSEIDRIEETVIHLKLDKQSIEALPAIPIRRR
jgi:sporulation protein YlmC with PRC-barrel domain